MLVTSFEAYEHNPHLSQNLIPRAVFFSDQHTAVYVMAQFKYSDACFVKMDWYVKSNPEQPLFNYEVSLPERIDGERFAFCAIDLRGLQEDAKFQIHQEWYVNLMIDGVVQRKTSFFIKKSGYGSSQNSSNIGRINVGV